MAGHTSSRLTLCCFIFFFKQKTAYEMRISDWSSDVCSSDLRRSMVVDRDGAAHIVVLDRMARDVDFADKARVEGVEPRHRIEPEIDGRNLDIVDVEQQAAAEIGRASCRERVCQYV